jgi:hypothetical protein
MHPDRTCLADRVVFYRQGDPCGHVAFAIETHADDPHCACLVFYCPKTHQWYEALNVQFGQCADSDYFVNPDA